LSNQERRRSPLIPGATGPPGVAAAVSSPALRPAEPGADVSQTPAERTLVLVKPDGVRRGLCGEVLRRIEAKGYTLAAVELRTVGEDLLSQHYAEHRDKPFYPSLVEFMSSGPVLAVVVEGVRCIEGFRSLAGKTDPTVAPPGTSRGDLGRDWGAGSTENIVHGSDSPESATREIGLWFPTL
jgi:nucleoside-diphosphate kinase